MNDEQKKHYTLKAETGYFTSKLPESEPDPVVEIERVDLSGLIVRLSLTLFLQEQEIQELNSIIYDLRAQMMTDKRVVDNDPIE